MTYSKIKSICDAVRKGMKPELAAEMCGVPRRVFIREMKDGEMDVENGSEDTDCAKLWKDVGQAKYDFAMACQLTIAQSIQNGDWKAAQFALKAAMPNDYGDKQNEETETEPIKIIEGSSMSMEIPELPEPNGLPDLPPSIGTGSGNA